LEEINGGREENTYHVVCKAMRASGLHVPESFEALFLSCFAFDAHKRPTAAELMKAPFWQHLAEIATRPRNTKWK